MKIKLDDVIEEMGVLAQGERECQMFVQDLLAALRGEHYDEGEDVLVDFFFELATEQGAKE